jgi:hypothetical protein
VLDPLSRAEFAERMTAWRGWLGRVEDAHSIRGQLVRMAYDHADFRVLRLAVRRVAHGKRGGLLSSHVLCSALFRGQMALSLLALRRLTDRNDEKSREKSIISLRRMVDELASIAPLLTREVFVTWDGAPYDPGPAEDAYWSLVVAEESADEKDAELGRWVEPPAHYGLPDFEAAERRHRVFDGLSGVCEHGRSPRDRVSDVCVRLLLARLDSEEIRAIRRVATKKLAHADERNSADAYGEGWDSVPLAQLRRAHAQVIGVAAFVALDILDEHLGWLVPVPQNARWAFLEEGGLTPREVDRLLRVPDFLRERSTRDREHGSQAIRRQMTELAGSPEAVARASAVE